MTFRRDVFDLFFAQANEPKSQMGKRARSPIFSEIILVRFLDVGFATRVLQNDMFC